jgi:RHS repeat-associated protein
MWLPEVGLYYFRARMYDARTGRFMQPDPIGYGDGANMYNAFGGDAVNRVDPSGMCSVWGRVLTRDWGNGDVKREILDKWLLGCDTPLPGANGGTGGPAEGGDGAAGGEGQCTLSGLSVSYRGNHVRISGAALVTGPGASTSRGYISMVNSQWTRAYGAVSITTTLMPGTGGVVIT